VLGTRVLRDGPEFLKRKFVRIRRKGELYVMPWRHEDDMFTKSCISANTTALEPDKWTSKYLGLMIDTMATNSFSYDAMRELYLRSMGTNPVVTIDIINRSLDCADGTLTKVLHRTGLAPSQIHRVLNPNSLFDEFVWDDEWRCAWACNYNLPLYDESGKAYSPIWNNILYTPLSYLQQEYAASFEY